MIAKVRQVLANFTRPTAAGILPSPPVIEKPTTVLANMIAADILMGKFKISTKDRARPDMVLWAGIRGSERYETLFENKLTSDKFLIEINSHNALSNPLYLSDNWTNAAFHLRIVTPVLSFDESDIEIVALAVKKRVWQVYKQKKEDAKFANHQKALDVIENWMGIKPAPETKE